MGGMAIMKEDQHNIVSLNQASIDLRLKLYIIISNTHVGLWCIWKSASLHGWSASDDCGNNLVIAIPLFIALKCFCWVHLSTFFFELQHYTYRLSKEAEE